MLGQVARKRRVAQDQILEITQLLQGLLHIEAMVPEGDGQIAKGRSQFVGLVIVGGLEPTVQKRQKAGHLFREACREGPGPASSVSKGDPVPDHTGVRPHGDEGVPAGVEFRLAVAVFHDGSFGDSGRRASGQANGRSVQTPRGEKRDRDVKDAASLPAAFPKRKGKDPQK